MNPPYQEELHGGPFGLRPLFARIIGVVIWLSFVLFPIVGAATETGEGAPRSLIVLSAVAFMVGYGYLVFSFRAALMRQSPQAWRQTAVLAAMIAIASLMTLVFSSGWGYLFCYCSACSALLATESLAFGCVALCSVLAWALPTAAGADGSSVVGIASGAAGVGLLMVLIRDLRRRNIELSGARAELARLAVAEERERFARDLHDLLGHSLSVIALKAELAGRLVEIDPARSAQEVADIESVAREALSEVRDAVSGYARPTLDGELDGARMALLAAGIQCEIHRDGAAPEPEAEAVLAWAVREGATNVVRHSAADRCVLRVSAERELSVVEVVDDGAVARTVAQAWGNGLSGLRERVAAMHGTMVAGPQADGGYRLAVEIPRGAGAA